MSHVIEGNLDASGFKFAIVLARFNGLITDRLLAGAMDALKRSGAKLDDIEIVKVPGSWELPLAVKTIAEAKKPDAIIALGAVIRGDTPHFDYICAEASRGLADTMTEYEIPIGFGLLTCDTMEQAEARAGGEHGNKGWDAAIAALEMSDLFERLDAADEG